MSKIFLQKLICETACGHDGNINNLIKLIKIAKKCGARTIKFQIFETLERAMPGTKEWNIFEKLELKDSNWSHAIKYAKKKKLFCTQNEIAYTTRVLLPYSINNVLQVSGP